MSYPQQFFRVTTLLGERGLSALRRSHVVLVGYGAVGSACAMALVRSGVGHIRLMDADVYDVTNINRQFGASHAVLGQSKVSVGQAQLLELVPDLDIEVCHQFVDSAHLECVFAPFSDGASADVVVDAIDTIDAKTALLLACVQRRIPVYSSMGAARKTSPDKIRFDDISKTTVCPLAREMRRRLRAAGVREGVRCVYSVEEAAKMPPPSDGQKRPVLGSLVTVTASFGLRLAAEIMGDILNSAQVSD